MSSYSADLIILGAESIYKLMGSVDKLIVSWDLQNKPWKHF